MLTHTTDVAPRRAVDDAEAYARVRRLLTFDTVPLPGRADVETAAARVASVVGYQPGQNVLRILDHYADWGVAEGRTYVLQLGPGAVTVRTSDLNRASHTDERAARARKTSADVLGLYVDEAGDLEVPDGPPSREVTGWSAKSRARMFRTIPQLDMSTWLVDGGPDGECTAMVTLTYPGDWLAVAPDGRTVKRHLDTFRKRWERAVGPWRCLWKFEFQRRGAPHVHHLLRVPVLVNGEPFNAWLSRTWADVVKADDVVCRLCSGLGVECLCERPDTEYRRHLAAGTAVDFDQRKMSDPRRIATYFLGHSSKHTDGKEYQHVVPEAWQAPGKGPGRFWGYTGLDLVQVDVVVGQDDYFRLRRVLRHVARARAWRQGQQALAAGKTPKPRRRLQSLGAHGGNLLGGTVVVNDGVRLGHDLAGVLALPRDPAPTVRQWLADRRSLQRQ